MPIEGQEVMDATEPDRVQVPEKRVSTSPVLVTTNVSVFPVEFAQRFVGSEPLADVADLADLAGLADVRRTLEVTTRSSRVVLSNVPTMHFVAGVIVHPMPHPSWRRVFVIAAFIAAAVAVVLLNQRGSGSAATW